MINRRVYVIGAVTMSADLPFRLLQMSEYPLVDPALYTGAWFPDKGVAYVAMVLGAVLVDGHDKVVDEMYDIHALENQGAQDGATVLISIGRQDLDGFVKRMPLDRLLRSLIDIGGPR